MLRRSFLAAIAVIFSPFRVPFRANAVVPLFKFVPLSILKKTNDGQIEWTVEAISVRYEKDETAQLEEAIKNRMDADNTIQMIVVQKGQNAKSAIRIPDTDGFWWTNVSTEKITDMALRIMNAN